jgi:hypothetical protein
MLVLAIGASIPSYSARVQAASAAWLCPTLARRADRDERHVARLHSRGRVGRRGESARRNHLGDELVQAGLDDRTRAGVDAGHLRGFRRRRRATHIALYDLCRKERIAEIDLESCGLHTIFTIVGASR